MTNNQTEAAALRELLQEIQREFEFASRGGGYVWIASAEDERKAAAFIEAHRPKEERGVSNG